MVELVAAATKLSEVLAESQREVLQRADAFNSADSLRWRTCTQWLIATNLVLVAVAAWLGWLLWLEHGVTRQMAADAGSDAMENRTILLEHDAKFERLELSNERTKKALDAIADLMAKP